MDAVHQTSASTHVFFFFSVNELTFFLFFPAPSPKPFKINLFTHILILQQGGCCHVKPCSPNRSIGIWTPNPHVIGQPSDDNGPWHPSCVFERLIGGDHPIRLNQSGVISLSRSDLAELGSWCQDCSSGGRGLTGVKYPQITKYADRWVWWSFLHPKTMW